MLHCSLVNGSLMSALQEILRLGSFFPKDELVNSNHGREEEAALHGVQGAEKRAAEQQREDEGTGRADETHLLGALREELGPAPPWRLSILGRGDPSCLVVSEQLAGSGCAMCPPCPSARCPSALFLLRALLFRFP